MLHTYITIYHKYTCNIYNDICYTYNYSFVHSHVKVIHELNIQSSHMFNIIPIANSLSDLFSAVMENKRF